jgi:hypothetical protein
MNNGRVLLGECAVFFTCVKYKNGLLNIMVRNALALEKNHSSRSYILPTFGIILVYWSQDL